MDEPLTITAFQFPTVLETLAIIAWSTSGAIVGRARGLDFMGVFFLAVLSSTGGGLIRDGVFLQRTPVMLTNTNYLVIPLASMIVVSFFGGLFGRRTWWNNLWDKLVSGIDALGTPAFGILGFQLAFLAGIPLVGAVFVGLVNGIAGGILRDVLVGTVPQIFRPGQYSGTVTLGGIVLYFLLLRYAGVDSDIAAWIAVLASAVARLLVIRFNWQSQPVSAWHMEQALARLPAELLARTPIPTWRPGQPDRSSSEEEPK